MTRRFRVQISGLVQGVGFRPFVFRTAETCRLSGFVMNDESGVYAEVEGHEADLDQFLQRMETTPPPLARVDRVSASEIDRNNRSGFRIEASRRTQAPTTAISPDVAICDDCLRELFDPFDRRYRYPFINCTNCGPRYTIVEQIPYDRPLTSMKGFSLCEACETEYEDPRNRRFHAQPNACSTCGPSISLRTPDHREFAAYASNGTTSSGNAISRDAIARVVESLKAGLIVAIKGLGGFHLAVDACNDDAVRRLRQRKGRAEKPFALMAASAQAIEQFCYVESEERTLLRDPRRPIVLLRARESHRLATSVAPGTKELGFMLAYTPLHHLILRDHFDALVMTSANRSEEPIAIDNEEAFERLAGIADVFLTHDRDILQRCDDSIVRVTSAGPNLIRRSRGFVPDRLRLPVESPRPLLACGGELKNTIALVRGGDVFLSQHIGDLDNPLAYRFFESSIGHLAAILEIAPEVVVHDLHPEYLSSKWALEQPHLEAVAVQHHHAHLAAVMAENAIVEPSIGIILDGTGYGTDGTIWGGEVLVGDLADFDRFSWLEPFRLPGGTAAIREPWRIGLALLDHIGIDLESSADIPGLGCAPLNERRLIQQMITQNINSPLTSSCGRLFDGISALLGFCSSVAYEAQAAIALEMISDTRFRDTYLAPGACSRGRGSLDWQPILEGVLGDLMKKTDPSIIASRFHHSLADLFTSAAVEARDQTGLNRVGLSGGVFQNQFLFTEMKSRLERAGFEVLTHRQVPCSDGGLAFGQAAVAAHRLSSRERPLSITHQTSEIPCA